MRKVFVLAILFIGMILVGRAQALTPAPTSCPSAPCLQMNWTDSGASATVVNNAAGQQISGPGTATMAYCIGGVVGCGTSPASPGTGNGWTQYTVPQTAPSGVGIIPGLAYGQLVNVVVAFQWTGGATSPWSATFQITLPATPPVIAPPTPTGLTGSAIL
jgi:hypothetical protein